MSCLFYFSNGDLVRSGEDVATKFESSSTNLENASQQ